MNQAFHQILETEFKKGDAAGVVRSEKIVELLVIGKSNSYIAKTLKTSEDQVERFRKLINPVN